jgi:hypothetical protein
MYPLNADSLFKRNHTVNIARLTNAHTILGESSCYVDFEGWVKSGYAIMQRSVASLFFVGNYVPRYSVLDAYSNSNGTFINVSPESESHGPKSDNNVVCLYSTLLLLFLIIIFG